MGTRGAVGVKSGGKLYVTYNHWDSYPDGLGQEMVEFCQTLSPEDMDIMAERFSHVKLVGQEDEASPEEQKIYMEKDFYDGSVSGQTPKEWYCLLMALQGIDFIKAVFEGECQHWIDTVNFLKDSLFCEYAYIINLDARVLEFYKGFNKEPDSCSPLPFEQVPDDRDEGGYYPVKFMGKAPLLNIPEDWMKQFYPEEEEAEVE